jgi:hypothetical protein
LDLAGREDPAQKKLAMLFDHLGNSNGLDDVGSDSKDMPSLVFAV